MATQKKVVRAEGGTSSPKKTEGASQAPPKTFVPTPESKSKATTLRVIAGILWALAIAAQICAIALLFRTPINMMWIIIFIVIDLVLAIIGSLLWKKSNRLDPAKKSQKVLFFLQSQLGLVTAVIAFMPFIIFVLTNKNVDGKQKGILTGIAAGALIIAGLLGADFNPPSVEDYTEQINRVEWLNNGQNDVYWTKSGRVYHIYDDCQHINTDRTDQIYEGTVAEARELKNITHLCKTCENRAIREHDLNEADYVPALTDAIPDEE